jgi:hypothetical protein
VSAEFVVQRRLGSCVQCTLHALPGVRETRSALAAVRSNTAHAKK